MQKLYKVFWLCFTALFMVSALMLSSLSAFPVNTNSLKQEISTTNNPVTLVMVEEQGCPYCRAWMRDIGSFYHKTSEGRFAPLKRVDIRNVKRQYNLNINFTPTFVVIRNGKEVGRLIGYIDDSFFWPMLDTILGKTGFKEDKKAS